MTSAGDMMAESVTFCPHHRGTTALLAKPSHTRWAASGSKCEFHSATAVVLPGWPQNVPPMIVRLANLSGMPPSSSRAVASVLSGPITTACSSPSWRMLNSLHARAPPIDDGARSVRARGAYPRPCSPWVSGVKSCATSTGPAAPLNTGGWSARGRSRSRSVRSPSSSHDKAEDTQSSTLALPAVAISPAISISPKALRARRSTIAIASSTPGSQSRRTTFVPVCRVPEPAAVTMGTTRNP